MIDSYFDESGRADRRLTVVSGYFGSTRDMRALSRDWQNALDRAGVNYFHAKDYDNRGAGVFRHLSMTRRKRLLDQLLQYAKRRMICGISAYVEDKLYEESTSPRFRSQWGAPYSFCVYTVLGKLALYLDELGRSQERINVVLEGGHRNVFQVLEQLHRPGGNFASIGVAPKEDQPVLQAADLLAYSTSDHLFQSENGKSYLFERVRATNKPVFLVHCIREYIQQFRAEVADYFQRRAEVQRALRESATVESRADIGEATCDPGEIRQ